MFLSTVCFVGKSQTENNCYTVLINGGVYDSANYEGYYNNVVFAFKTLVNKYNYPKSNIYVLNSDGLDHDDDMMEATGDDPEWDPEWEATSSPHNLDGVAGDDIDKACVEQSFIDVFDDLEIELSSIDFLFVYLTGVSEPTQNNRYYLWDNPYLTGEDYLTDSEVADYINQTLPGKLVILTGYPFSGTIEDNLQEYNRVICTNGDSNDDVNWKNGYGYGYEEFSYYWFSAIAGETPEGTTVDADANSDGHVSIKEAFSYAESNTTGSNSPQYYSSSINMGENLTMGAEELCVTTYNLHDYSLTWDATISDCHFDIDNFTITNNIEVILNARGTTTIHADFLVENGSSLLIQ